MGVLVYLKDMEMPRDCYECDADFAQAIRCNHWMEGTYMGKGRPKRCPLAEISDGPQRYQGDTITIKAEAIT